MHVCCALCGTSTAVDSWYTSQTLKGLSRSLTFSLRSTKRKNVVRFVRQVHDGMFERVQKIVRRNDTESSRYCSLCDGLNHLRLSLGFISPHLRTRLCWSQEWIAASAKKVPFQRIAQYDLLPSCRIPSFAGCITWPRGSIGDKPTVACSTRAGNKTKRELSRR